MGLIASVRKKARPMARFGCFSIGTVYVLVGVLALLALSGILIEAADEERMVYVMLGIPGGALLIWSIVAGMFAYLLWRLAEAVTDPYEFGSDWKGLAHRTGIALTGLSYGFVAVGAARIARGPGGNGEQSEEQQQLMVSHILGWPAGPWIVGAAGVAVAIVALAQFVVLIRRAYLLEIDVDALSRTLRRAVHVLAWAGYSARAVILAVLGYFLVRGAYRTDAELVGDTDTAFDFIGGGLVGDSAFFLVAIGTIAYGAYMYMCGAFYKFETTSGAAQTSSSSS